MWAALIIAALNIYLGYICKNARQELAERKAQDSVDFKEIREWQIQAIQRQARNEKALEQSENSRVYADLMYHKRDSAKDAAIRYCQRKAAQVNTSSASVPELDSLQFAMFGPAPDDSLHTIPLDYSRKLTGDALRLPIEQRIATLAVERYDSATAHYGRTLDSYRVDLEMSRQDNAADHETMSEMMKAAEKMQGVITDQDRKFHRKRTRERIVEGIIMVGVVILAL